jgi:hypothetical protein
MTLTLDAAAFRRFVLGKQGLYPGRRWRGKDGTADALRACEAVQIDPLHITQRNHDIILYSRVLDYTPAHLDELAHHDRRAFDYGTLLFYYPIEDLPYFKAVMRWWGEQQTGQWEYENMDTALIAFVREQLRARGALSNRHFEGGARLTHYRARKDTGLALRYMWLSGELFTHSRTRFERNFHFMAEHIPDDYSWEATPQQALDYFTLKALSFYGIAGKTLWGKALFDLYERRHPSFDATIRALTEQGVVTPVHIAGKRDVRYLLTRDVPDVQALADGRIPAAWTPLDVTTHDEVTFLASLDVVSARGRAADVFGFEYKWEVYTPAPKRRWGYYVLPILYGDQLVGRFDPKMDRKTNTLHIHAFYLEDDFTPDDAFAHALGRGLARFARFNGAAHVECALIQPDFLRNIVRHYID